MYQGKPTRRDFLIGTAGGLVAIAQATAPSLFAQAGSIRGIQALRQYAIKLYEETDSYNYIRDGQGDKRSRPGQEMRSPYLLQGEVDGRRTRVIVHKDLPSGPYSLETKTYFNREDVPFGGIPELDDLSGLFLFPYFASNVFLDKGINGNLQGRTDAVTAVSMNPKAVEYSMFTGDGGYQFTQLLVPQNINERERMLERWQNLYKSLESLKLPETELQDLLGILTSFDWLPNGSGSHTPNVLLPLLDGVAWHSPTGIVQSYWDLSLDNSRSVNVGTRPRLIGSYSGTSHAELQRRRKEAIDNANRVNSGIMQRTLDTLVEEKKIILPQNL